VTNNETLRHDVKIEIGNTNAELRINHQLSSLINTNYFYLNLSAILQQWLTQQV